MTASDGYEAFVGTLVDPTEMATSLPGILGYYPRRHFILVTGRLMDDAVTGDTAVVLGPLAVCKTSVAESLAEGIVDLIEGLRENGCTHVSIYVVDPRWATADHHEIADLASDYARSLMRFGIGVQHIVGMAEIHEGEPITDVMHDCVGVVGNPAETVAAKKMMAAGEVIAATEEAAAERFTLFEGIPAAQRKILDIARKGGFDDISDPSNLALRPDDQRAGRFYREWLALVEQLDAGVLSLQTVFSEAAYARTVVRMFMDVTLRDMMIANVDSPEAATVRELWLATAQMMAGTIRCNALACYAIDRLNVGAVSAAKMALQAAENENPQHSLTSLLQMAIIAGIEVECLDTIKRAAQELIWMTR